MIAAAAPPFDIILGSDILREGGDIVGSYKILAQTLAALSRPMPSLMAQQQQGQGERQEQDAANSTNGDPDQRPLLPEATIYLCVCKRPLSLVVALQSSGA